MVREFEEETNLHIPPGSWLHVVTWQGPDYEIQFFTAASDDIFEAKAVTDEVPVRIHIEGIYSAKILPNLRWIIPLCLERKVVFPLFITQKQTPKRLDALPPTAADEQPGPESTPKDTPVDLREKPPGTP
jgi:hypothetical protein